MNRRIKIHISYSGKTIRLSTKLSNHNVAIIWFEQDGLIMDGESYFFKKDHYNWWAVMYVGPLWKYPFSRDNKCYGTTTNPLEGLIACKQMLQYFIDNILKEHDIIEVSGSTLRRDAIYENALKSMGFRYVSKYCDIVRIMIFVKDSTPKTITKPDGEQVMNPDNAWVYLASHCASFSDYPYFTKEDYDYKHLTPITRTIVCLSLYIWEYIKTTGEWLKHKIQGNGTQD